MPAVIFTMLIVLGVAAGIIAVVVMGMEGTGRARHPEIADAMARTARHLNGEGRPPRGLTQLFDEIDEVNASDFDPRQIPGRLKSSIASVRTAVSARSATSARSAASAPELDLITVPPATPASAVESTGLTAAAITAADGEAASPWAPPARSSAPETQSDAVSGEVASGEDEATSSGEVAEVPASDEIHQAAETNSVAEVPASDQIHQAAETNSVAEVTVFDEADETTASDEVADALSSDELKADLARALEAPASEVVFDDPCGVTGASASTDDFEDPYGVRGTSHHEIVPADDPDQVSDDTIVHGKLPLS